MPSFFRMDLIGVPDPWPATRVTCTTPPLPSSSVPAMVTSSTHLDSGRKGPDFEADRLITFDPWVTTLLTAAFFCRFRMAASARCCCRCAARSLLMRSIHKLTPSRPRPPGSPPLPAWGVVLPAAAAEPAFAMEGSSTTLLASPRLTLEPSGRPASPLASSLALRFMPLCQGLTYARAFPFSASDTSSPVGLPFCGDFAASVAATLAAAALAARRCASFSLRHFSAASAAASAAFTASRASASARSASSLCRCADCAFCCRARAACCLFTLARKESCCCLRASFCCSALSFSWRSRATTSVGFTDLGLGCSGGGDCGTFSVMGVVGTPTSAITSSGSSSWFSLSWAAGVAGSAWRLSLRSSSTRCSRGPCRSEDTSPGACLATRAKSSGLSLGLGLPGGVLR
mmetsp:Transcript_661/g.1998  ORF Transcript_661/g.1998 Transcript_661/m.1998 type:complete len:402 (+) Transcript_661:341-1546(+)